MMNKQYIGDSVYVALDEFGRLVLTTENGYTATNTIVLEAEVYEELVRYVHARWTGAAAVAENNI